MDPFDSSVEPVGAASGAGVRRRTQRRMTSKMADSFFAWLKEETIAITAEHFGSHGTRTAARLTQLGKLARTA